MLPSRGRSVGLQRSGPQLYCAFGSAIGKEDGLKSAASPGRAPEGAACSWMKWLGELNGNLEGRSMFNEQAETRRGTLGEQGHPAGEMAPYSRLQGC